MEDAVDRKRQSQVLTGVLLIVLGLIFLGDRLDVVPQMDIGRLWPVILIVLGAGHLLTPREDGRSGSGGWLIFVGVLFLLNNYRVMTLHQSWPLFIVAGGVSVLFGRPREPRVPGGDR